MRKQYVILFFLLFTITSVVFSQSDNNLSQVSSTTIRMFDEVLYYDGYDNVIYDSALRDAILRHSNSLYSVMLTPNQLSAMGDEITMQVIVKAACDNYDRIGNVNLAFVNKGDTSYLPDSVERIEIGRFITPFMDKNVSPDTVPYSYNVDYLKHIFKDKNITGKYDIWVELEIFGVPYAANEEIDGCSGRSDVFKATLDFITTSNSAIEEDDNILIPLYIKHDFNNYNESATDVVGETDLTKEFWLEEGLDDVAIILITSNHGSNSGGEEYKRRDHFVYIDDSLQLSYKPGRTSCEPFRVYNTQSNGIYGYSKKTDAQWQSFSNWCPGDVIDNRIIQLTSLSAGNHVFKISVPDAVFKGGQGNIPLSVYVLGKKSSSNTILNQKQRCIVYPNPADEMLNINSTKEIVKVQIYSMTGILIKQSSNSAISLQNMSSGMYNVQVSFEDGTVLNYKIIKN